jgi:hypothetical protein
MVVAVIASSAGGRHVIGVTRGPIVAVVVVMARARSNDQDSKETRVGYWPVMWPATHRLSSPISSPRRTRSTTSLIGAARRYSRPNPSRRVVAGVLDAMPARYGPAADIATARRDSMRRCKTRTESRGPRDSCHTAGGTMLRSPGTPREMVTMPCGLR